MGKRLGLNPGRQHGTCSARSAAKEMHLRREAIERGLAVKASLRERQPLSEGQGLGRRSVHSSDSAGPVQTKRLKPRSRQGEPEELVFRSPFPSGGIVAPARTKARGLHR